MISLDRYRERRFYSDQRNFLYALSVSGHESFTAIKDRSSGYEPYRWKVMDGIICPNTCLRDEDIKHNGEYALISCPTFISTRLSEWCLSNKDVSVIIADNVKQVRELKQKISLMREVYESYNR